MIDDSGDRKDGTATAHMRRQWSGWPGKTYNGIVTVNAVPTDGRVHYPPHAHPNTPAHHFACGRPGWSCTSCLRSPCPRRS
ncbi:hypothetical protein AB0G86_02170 [Streptomyces scabiei]